jgi:hypothetical protein
VPPAKRYETRGPDYTSCRGHVPKEHGSSSIIECLALSLERVADQLAARGQDVPPLVIFLARDLKSDHTQPPPPTPRKRLTHFPIVGESRGLRVILWGPGLAANHPPLNIGKGEGDGRGEASAATPLNDHSFRNVRTKNVHQTYSAAGLLPRRRDRRRTVVPRAVD